MIYQAQVTLVSPMALTQRRATGNDAETLHYIPGTTLRGALAAALLASGKQGNDPEFEALFLNGHARFGSLRLEGADPWPLSTRTCKEWRMDHPVIDRLLRTAAGWPLDQDCQGEVFQQTEPCRAKVEHPAGYVQWEKQQSGSRHSGKNATLRRAAHAAIDQVRLTTKAGQLFTVQSLEAGQTFRGRIVAEGPAAAVLEALAPGKGCRLRMGRAKTRGQGLVDFRISKVRDGPGRVERERCRERLDRTQEAARRVGGRLADKRVVTVTLLSPALLLDDLLLSHAVAKQADVGLGAEWKLLGWYSEMTRITGWHAAAGVPRTETAMAAAGSCFLYAAEAPTEDLVEWAVQLEHEGIGERRGEGFGEVVVCHDVHARYAEA